MKTEINIPEGIERELDDMGLKFYIPDRELPDVPYEATQVFCFRDKDGDKDYISERDLITTAWVWDDGDVGFMCEHPDIAIEYDDDETVGECVLCGSTCNWHYEVGADDGYTTRERVPHSWERPDNAGGIIKKVLEAYNERR